MVCLGNMCVDTLHKGDNDEHNNNNNNNNNNIKRKSTKEATQELEIEAP